VIRPCVPKRSGVSKAAWDLLPQRGAPLLLPRGVLEPLAPYTVHLLRYTISRKSARSLVKVLLATYCYRPCGQLDVLLDGQSGNEDPPSASVQTLTLLRFKPIELHPISSQDSKFAQQTAPASIVRISTGGQLCHPCEAGRSKPYSPG